MMTIELATEIPVAGPCSDCGVVVSRRVECLDSMTHSRLELCQVCWGAFHQRQVFAGGCCG
jgi:hypothetical protein